MAIRSPRPRGTTRDIWSSSGDTERPARIFQVIWEIVARVPRGRVVTYGQVARLAGIPGGARTVGWAMRALPASLRIAGRPVPWHRVINARGGISPRGATSGVPETVLQARALRREGIAVSPGGTIDLGRHQWSGRTWRTVLSINRTWSRSVR